MRSENILSLEINKEKILTTIKILWLMYIIFPFRIIGIDVFQRIIYYGISGILFVIFLRRLVKYRINTDYLRNFLFSFLILICLTLMAYTVPVEKNTFDFSYYSSFLYYWVRVFMLVSTIPLFRNALEYAKAFIKAVNLYILFSLVLLIPRIHTWYQGIVIDNANATTVMNEALSRGFEVNQSSYTRFGLQGFSGFECTILCSIAVLFCCYFIINSLHNNESIKGLFIELCFSLIGNALYGRSGLMISILIVVVTVVYAAIIYQKVDLLFKFGVIIVAMYFYILFNENTLKQNDSISWMLEGVFNFIDNGKFSTESSDMLKMMYIHPSVQTFLSGDGYYMVSGHFYMMTDVGYLRPLLFWGIFGTILYYSLLLPSLSSIEKNFEKIDKFFVLLTTLILIVGFEIKGEAALLIFTIFLPITGIGLLCYNRPLKRVYNVVK